MEETLRVLVALAIAVFLVILRFEAEKFGAAEYDEPRRDGHRASVLLRLSWILLGFALVGALLVVHPHAAVDLGITLGDRGEALLLGFGFGALGTLQAAAYAYFRYAMIRLPPPWTYPGAVFNGIGTAFLDEATFRGAVLGFLLLAGINPTTAVIISAFLYTLATRTGAPGRGRYMFILTLVGGLAAGWLTATTGGIGAAFLAHAVTRIAVFVCTGHAGQPALRGQEIEESWEYRTPPRGWRSLDRPDDGGPSER
ncbi:MAG: CPBP family intramembrane glutamic endopeptidase [Chloroflexota bacterium]